MNPLSRFRYRLAAALSPAQMNRRYNRPTHTDDEMRSFGYKYTDPDSIDFSVYDEMLRDPQIQSAYELIRLFLLSRQVRVTPATDNEEDIIIAEFIEDIFNNMDYPLRKARNDMYSALIYGFSVSEIIYGTDKQDRVIIKRLEPLDVQSLEHPFIYKEDGDVDKVRQEPETGEEILIPGEKCLIYTYNEKFRNRKGESILKGLYDYWYDKQKIINWRNSYLQKHEGPTLVGYVDNPSLKDGMLEQLEDVREGRTNITASKDDRIEVLETRHRGEAFNEAIKHIDVMIYRKFNLGTMILGQEDGRGAYAQSQTQHEILNKFLDGIHEDIATELSIIIKRLVDLNFNTDRYPNITFTSFEEKNSLELLEKLKPYVDNMVIRPMDTWFQELIKTVVEKHSDLKMEGMEINETTGFGVLEETTNHEHPQPSMVEEEEITPLIDIMENIPPREEQG